MQVGRQISFHTHDTVLFFYALHTKHFHCTHTQAWCGSPGGVAVPAKGSYYATQGLYACAEPDAGTVAWKTMLGNSGRQDVNLGGSRSVVKDDVGSVYIAGRTDTGLNGQTMAIGEYRSFVSKYDSSGKHVWTTIITSDAQAYTDDITIDSQRRLYVGVRYRNVNKASVIVRLNSDTGSESWTSVVSVLAVLADSNLALGAGPEWVYVSYRTTAGAYISRFAADGGVIQKTFDLPITSQDEPRTLATTQDGGGFVAGDAKNGLSAQAHAGGASDMFVSKFNYDGTFSWTRLLGSTGDDFVRSIAVDIWDNVYVAGFVDSGVAPANSVMFDGQAVAGGQDGFVVKYAVDGTKLWSALQGTSAADSARTVDVDDAGNVVVVGKTAGNLFGQILASTDFNDISIVSAQNLHVVVSGRGFVGVCL
jgi:hypothetical protein